MRKKKQIFLEAVRMEKGETGGTETGMETHRVLREWGLLDDTVSASFDTTRLNVGHLTAAVITLQNLLGRPLLWFACRHHVMEVILDHVWKDLKIEDDTSPELCIFKKFREAFNAVKKDITTAHLQYFEPKKPYLKRLHAEVLAELREISSNYHPRDDYKECLFLCILFLEGAPVIPVCLLKGGSVSKARWMNKIIFAIKILMCWPLIDEDDRAKLLSDEKYKNLEKFVTFVVYIYSVFWFKAPLSVESPRNDLELYRRILHYKHVDQGISKSALEATENHRWYITECTVPLAFFDPGVPADKLNELAESYQSFAKEYTGPKNRYGSGFGRPVMPAVSYGTDLTDLIGPSSKFFFQALKLDDSFMVQDSSLWKTNQAFLSGKERVEKLLFVNDLAERGVKLASDFMHMARKEDRFQNTLQVVEDDRKKRPNLRGSKKARFI